MNNTAPVIRIKMPMPEIVDTVWPSAGVAEYQRENIVREQEARGTSGPNAGNG